MAICHHFEYGYYETILKRGIKVILIIYEKFKLYLECPIIIEKKIFCKSMQEENQYNYIKIGHSTNRRQICDLTFL